VTDGSRRRRELARADRVLPRLWRLRLPLPWPGVPHVNAFAIAAGSGIVLVDTGLHEPGSLGQLERALDQASLRLEHVRLVVCTHAHVDHYGQAGPIVHAAGCELWMHPNHAHVTQAASDPDSLLERRLEVARNSGVPAAPLAEWAEARRGQDLGVAEVVLPDRELVDGVEVETDLGSWRVYETPGHAPSHVVLHQPERRLLLSGDHLLGRVSIHLDYGYTPDPAGEFLSSLDTVDQLDVQLVLAGHGRPVRDAHGLVRANKRTVEQRLQRLRELLREGPKTPYECVDPIMEIAGMGGLPRQARVAWILPEVLSYLTHLERLGEAERIEGEPERWRASG
jgi:glyoxylase-like metal-dependent hydrolase (beta-lactamase superfamily II)